MLIHCVWSVAWGSTFLICSWWCQAVSPCTLSRKGPKEPRMVRQMEREQETWLRSLSWEDLLEEGMATHSRILAWRVSWTEEPGRLQSMGSQRVGQDWVTFTFKKNYSCVKGGKKEIHMINWILNIKNKFRKWFSTSLWILCVSSTWNYHSVSSLSRIHGISNSFTKEAHTLAVPFNSEERCKTLQTSTVSLLKITF